MNVSPLVSVMVAPLPLTRCSGSAYVSSARAVPNTAARRPTRSAVSGGVAGPPRRRVTSSWPSSSNCRSRLREISSQARM